MKVKQLKEILEDLDDDLEVVMSIDPEGNGFSGLYQVETGDYEEEGFEGMSVCLWPE